MLYWILFDITRDILYRAGKWQIHYILQKFKKVCRSLCCIFLCILNFKSDKSKQNFWKYFYIFFNFFEKFFCFYFFKRRLQTFYDAIFMQNGIKINKLKSFIVKMGRYNIFWWIFHLFIWFFIYLRSSYEIKSSFLGNVILGILSLTF